jgi:hypothetical protein
MKNITVRALRAQTRNASFLETGFTGQKDFTIVWNSVTSNGPPKNDPFRFQGNIVKANCI